MATTLTAPQFGATLSAKLTAGTLAAPTTSQVNDSTPYAFTVGSGVGNVSNVYSGSLSIGTSPTTLDLTSLVDPLGGTINFGHVSAIKVTNNGTVATTVTVGGGTTPIFAALPPLSSTTNTAGTFDLLFPAELATSGANNLKLQSDTAATPVSITIFGR